MKSVGALMGGNLISALLTAIGGLIIARFIAPEINGQFRLFTIPLMYISFLHLGTFDGLSRQIPFYTGKDKPEQVERIASASGAWNVFITIIVSSGFLVCELWALWNNNYEDAIGWLTQLLACAGVFYGGYLGATYRTLNNFVVLSGIQLIQAAISFCLVFTVVIWGFYGLCLRFALPVVLGIWLSHRFRPLRMPLHFKIAAFKDVVKIGIPLCFWGTLYNATWQAVEFSLILKFGGAKAVGLFSVAIMMRDSVSILPHSIHLVLMPRMVELFARKGGVKEATKRTLLGTAALTLLMVGVVLIVDVILDYFVPLVIPKYIEGLPLMKAAMWLVVIHAASLPLNSLVATGRGWLYGKGILIGMVAFAYAFYLLNPIIGSVLAAIYGSLIGRLTKTVVAYIDLFVLIQDESKQA